MQCPKLKTTVQNLDEENARLPAANAQPPRFALRVCEKCDCALGSQAKHQNFSSCYVEGSMQKFRKQSLFEVGRKAGNGYNPMGALKQTARGAAEVSQLQFAVLFWKMTNLFLRCLSNFTHLTSLDQTSGWLACSNGRMGEVLATQHLEWSESDGSTPLAAKSFLQAQAAVIMVQM